METVYNLSDKQKSDVFIIYAPLPALPLVPSGEPAPPVDPEGTDGAKNGCVTWKKSSRWLAPLVACGLAQGRAGLVKSCL